MKLIINADDFGLNSEVNKAIEKAAKDGHITSATILANSKSWDCIQRVSNLSIISLGVHLNLTEGKSITNSVVLRNYNIIDINGFFTNKREVFNNMISTELQEAIYNEFREQIILVKNKLNVISHIDGHHHCHTWFGLEFIIKKLIEDFGIKSVRGNYSWPISNPKQRINNNRVFEKLMKCEIKTKYFTSYENAINKINSFNFFHQLRLRRSTVELMCHPGHLKNENEFILIKHHEIENVLNCNVELVKYSDL